jgi:dolichol-phosphate mannosyltransferase
LRTATCPPSPSQAESDRRARLGQSRKLVVVIPTYNERENIALLVPAIERELCRLPYESHILVVDDNSPDGTAQEVRALAAVYPRVCLDTGPRLGLGAAYLRGLRYALENLHADIVIQMDADFSHKAEDIPSLLASLEKGNDVVIGSRYVSGGSIEGDWSPFRKWQSAAANLLVRFVCGMRDVRDCTAGFRAIRGDVLRRMDVGRLTAQGYSFQIQLLHEAFQQGATICEVPTQFADRVRGETKLGTSLRERLDFVVHSCAIRVDKGWPLKLTAVAASGVAFNLILLFLLVRWIDLPR